MKASRSDNGSSWSRGARGCAEGPGHAKRAGRGRGGEGCTRPSPRGTPGGRRRPGLRRRAGPLRAGSGRAAISAKPSRFRPRQRAGSAARSSSAARPMPHIRSSGLASTSTRESVPSRNSRSAGSWPNLWTLPSTTRPKRSPLPYRPRRSRGPGARPPWPAAGCRAASARRSASASSNSRALPAIIQCSAVAYRTPSTVKGEGHHWLKQLAPRLPSRRGLWPQKWTILDALAGGRRAAQLLDRARPVRGALARDPRVVVHHAGILSAGTDNVSGLVRLKNRQNSVA